MRTDELVVLACALVLILLRLTTRADEFGRGIVSLTVYALVVLTALNVILT